VNGSSMDGSRVYISLRGLLPDDFQCNHPLFGAKNREGSASLRAEIEGIGSIVSQLVGE